MSKRGKESFVLLVIDYSVNWYERFKGCQTSSGRKIVVEQVEWKDLHVEASSDGRTLCYLREAQRPFPFTSQKNDRVVSPDFVLIRNFPRDLHGVDYKNTIMGLMFNDVPAINSLLSVLLCSERTLQYSQLLKASKQLGSSGFELIPLIYHSNFMTGSSCNLFKEEYPLVVKVGSTHAGFGKAKVKSEADMDDIRSILALGKDYYTTEPFIGNIAYEYRIQKIGAHYRAFRRNSSTSWKGNWGNLQWEDEPWQDRYKSWVDEVAKIYGGLDILAIDMLHTVDGRDICLELNDTAPGLYYKYEDEDLNRIKSLVLERINILQIERNPSTH